MSKTTLKIESDGKGVLSINLPDNLFPEEKEEQLPHIYSRAWLQGDDGVAIVLDIDPEQEKVLVSYLPDVRDDEESLSWLGRRSWQPWDYFKFDDFPMTSGLVKEVRKWQEDRLVEKLEIGFLPGKSYTGQEVVDRIRGTHIIDTELKP